jgi:predicted dehydrogenase
MKKVKWGILSTAKIGREKVIPAIQKGSYCEVVAIASRDIERAKETAKNLQIRKVYGSYEGLLTDREIDAIYIPLPNHLHVEWAIKGLEAGKHVLCEKPIGLSSSEAEKLLQISEKYPQLKVMEAFMYRFHPQWIYAKDLLDNNRIGELKTIQSFFSYYNADPNNIRNKVEVGGGGMMDIGCYSVSLSRFLFDEEPKSVVAMLEQDPVMGTDRITSGMMNFSKGSSTFTCSTQLMPYQHVNILGTSGRIEIEIPFNPLPTHKTKILLHTISGIEEIVFDEIDQYTVQADSFAKAILEYTPVPFNIKDGINNMKVIEAILSSAKDNRWKSISH